MKVWRDSLRLACRAVALATALATRERRLVDQNRASWNRFGAWLRRLHGLRGAFGLEWA